MKTQMKKTLDATVLAAAVVGSLVLLNVIGLGLFGRLDLTKNREFTLSEATRQTLKGLRDPVTVRAYFSRDLPPPHSTNARYVKDLLDEYYAQAKGNIRYEFVDPTSEETDADKEKKKEVKNDIFGRAVREETSVEKELRTLGIPPVQVRVNEGDKVEVKRAYMGIVIRFGEKKEVIPVVAETSGLEYDLTTMIRKVSREKAPKIALLTGHDGPEPMKEMSRFYGLLGQLYDVTTLDLSQRAEISQDVSAIIAVGPKKPFSEAEQKAIDAFVASGRSAAFLLGSVAPDLRTMQATPIDHGLTAMLGTWGVNLGSSLVLDAESASINVSSQQGFMRVTQPVRYPFIPTPKSLDAKHPLTRGLAGVAFPFMNPVSIAPNLDANLKADLVVKSSPKSFAQEPPFNLDPFQQWRPETLKDEGAKGLVAVLSGPVKSHFGAQAEGGAKDARVLVAGGYEFVLDDFMSQSNQALALNLFDWMVQDDALLAIRTRGLAAAPISSEVSDAKRNTLKYLNIVGLPLVFVAFGLARWRMRETRRLREAL